MRRMITDDLDTPKYKKVKVRAINTNMKSIKLFEGVKDAASYFKVSSQKICRTILEKAHISLEDSTYTLERYC